MKVKSFGYKPFKKEELEDILKLWKKINKKPNIYQIFCNFPNRPKPKVTVSQYEIMPDGSRTLDPIKNFAYRIEERFLEKNIKYLLNKSKGVF